MSSPTPRCLPSASNGMKAARTLLLALGGLAGLASAQAGLTVTLTPATQTGLAGAEVEFSGVLTNTSPTDKLFLNDIAVTLTGASAIHLTLRPNTFFAHVPGILLPGETYNGPLF